MTTNQLMSILTRARKQLLQFVADLPEADEYSIPLCICTDTIEAINRLCKDLAKEMRVAKEELKISKQEVKLAKKTTNK